MVNPPVLVPDPESPFVTITSRAPKVAPAEILTDTVILVELFTVGELCKVTPLPLNATPASLLKLAPLIFTDSPDVPCALLVGVKEFTIGFAFTVKQPTQVPL